MKSFDDLFNEFFNRKKSISPIHDEIKKIIEGLTNIKKPSMEAEDMIAQQLGINLDEPTSTEEHIENGMRFTKLIWDTPRGRFMKIVVTDVVDTDNIIPKQQPKEQKSLEEQLQEAVDNEDYELAIKLRDRINKLKEIDQMTEMPKRKRKKSS